MALLITEENNENIIKESVVYVNKLKQAGFDKVERDHIFRNLATVGIVSDAQGQGGMLTVNIMDRIAFHVDGAYDNRVGKSGKARIVFTK
jgi:hypothetical protein